MRSPVFKKPAFNKNVRPAAHSIPVNSSSTTAPLSVRPLYSFLTSEMDRIKKEAIFEQQVFFIQNLGFIEPTDVRRISFEESLRFEKIHEDVYRDHGFSLTPIVPGRVTERVDAIKAAIEHDPASFQ